MIDIIENYTEYEISPLIPALDEFELAVTKTLVGIAHDDLTEKLFVEAQIYGELVQILDRHGLRTFGLATAIKKYYSYFIVEVYINDPQPRTIRKIKIPIKQTI
ncbi:hypothetical protein [Desulfotruncus alcoholivorax]|uniref:hypothetical protein n=1 Tax=Desulfotruncus alcoholivorax TaxID=265477 RepID=UPI00040C6913|nr:hypothetical protein [Desulfotruncus alcoholivorax]